MTDRDQQVNDLYEVAGTRVLGYLARRAESPDDAADMFGDVMVVAWRRRHDLPPPPQDVLWLFGVARRVLAGHRRGARRRDQAVTELARALRRHVPIAGSQHRLSEVREAIDRLSRVDREVLTLSAWEGLTAVEIGIVLGMPAASVRSRLLRARARLRHALGGVEQVPTKAK